MARTCAFAAGLALLVVLAALSVVHAAKPPPPRRSPPPRRVPPPPAPPPPPASLRTRLVGPDADDPVAPKGTLMIAPAGTPNDPLVFRYICDDGNFMDEHAVLMCSTLGFKYGRLYYAPQGNEYQVPAAVDETDGHVVEPALFMWCSTRAGSGRRRLLHEGGGGISMLYMPIFSNTLCGFTPALEALNPLLTGLCSEEKWVGISCSSAPFQPAPPPPPSPPTRSPPPPRPPNRSAEVKLVVPEANLCPDGSAAKAAGLCLVYQTPYFWRVEVVAEDNSTAPLCWSNATLAYGDDLVTLICRQKFDWPYNLQNNQIVGRIVQQPLPIPDAAPAAGGGFNPTKYTAWATLAPKPADEDEHHDEEGSASESPSASDAGHAHGHMHDNGEKPAGAGTKSDAVAPRHNGEVHEDMQVLGGKWALQELGVSSSGTPCEEGKLLAIACYAVTYQQNEH